MASDVEAVRQAVEAAEWLVATYEDAGALAEAAEILATNNEALREQVERLTARVADLEALLRRAWDFPDYPSPAEGCVSTTEDVDEQEVWQETRCALDAEIRRALDETGQQEAT